jgi:hypothetical protein
LLFRAIDVTGAFLNKAAVCQSVFSWRGLPLVHCSVVVIDSPRHSIAAFERTDFRVAARADRR